MFVQQELLLMEPSSWLVSLIFSEVAYLFYMQTEYTTMFSLLIQRITSWPAFKKLGGAQLSTFLSDKFGLKSIEVILVLCLSHA